jgi:PiT family inorganic phosphate transporter
VAVIGVALTVVGAAASFTMGANDVANAAGSLVGTGTFTPLAAGAVCGAGLAVGVLTWGRPLLRKVAFDIVAVDRPMATAAQLVQAAVVLTAVAFGLFTSMNQALVGAMAGAGLARGRHTVKTASLYGILRGWLIGPAAGLAAGLVITLAVRAAGATLN